MLSAWMSFALPLIAFTYGILLIFVIHHPRLREIGIRQRPELFRRLESRRVLAWVCFCVGALWSLQNLLG